MNDCLSAEKLELLAARKLRGREFSDALRHLEECAECRSQIRMPTVGEILKRLEDDRGDSSSSPSKSESEAPNPEFEKLLDKLRRKSQSSGSSDVDDK